MSRRLKQLDSLYVEYEPENIYFASVRSPGIASSEDLIFPESWDKNKALLKKFAQKDLLVAEINRSTS